MLYCLSFYNSTLLLRALNLIGQGVSPVSKNENDSYIFALTKTEIFSCSPQASTQAQGQTLPDGTSSLMTATDVIDWLSSMRSGQSL